MKMRKSLILAAMVAAVSLSACKKSDEAPPADSGAAPATSSPAPSTPAPAAPAPGGSGTTAPSS